MELNEEQKNAIRQWVKDGYSLAEVQKKISEEFGISMTYMDVRFLVIDLGVEPEDKPEPEPRKAEPEIDAVTAEAQPNGEAGAMKAAGMAGGAVSVEVDRITKPGSVVSGTVTFSDGVTANWMLDQIGRLAIDAGQAGYKPREEDIQAFQNELRNALSQRGF